MANADPRYLDLHDLVDVQPTFELDTYAVTEREVLTPALEAAGYLVGAWYTGERDSFGPLTRCAPVTKDGLTRTVVYG